MIAAPGSQYVGQERVCIRKVDTIFNQFYKKGDRLMMKIDTQGFEREVLEGASDSLVNVVLIQLETSIIPLYERELILPDMILYLDKKKFKLVSIETGGFVCPQSHHLLQVDCLFLNTSYS